MAVGVRLTPIPDSWPDWIEMFTMVGIGGGIYIFMVWILNIANCNTLAKNFLQARRTNNHGTSLEATK